MKLRPVGNRIVVEPAAAETVTVTGIVLPESAQEKPARAKVLAVGPGTFYPELGRYQALGVEAGETIFYSKYAGAPVEHEGKALLILREEDVLVVDDGAEDAS